MSCRKNKGEILALLGRGDLAATMARLAQLPPKDVINVLFSALCREEAHVRWHAVTCMGEAVARLAGEDMEAARIVMRRLLWSLNDESGGIGWGAPECLAECMSLSPPLAREYAHMLISYMREDGEEICQDGNFLEHPLLQRGLLWGVARLAGFEPALLNAKGAANDLPKYLLSPDPEIRGLAVLALGSLSPVFSCPELRGMATDEAAFSLYRNGEFFLVRVGELVRQVLAVEAL